MQVTHAAGPPGLTALLGAPAPGLGTDWSPEHQVGALSPHGHCPRASNSGSVVTTRKCGLCVRVSTWTGHDPGTLSRSPPCSSEGQAPPVCVCKLASEGNADLQRARKPEGCANKRNVMLIRRRADVLRQDSKGCLSPDLPASGPPTTRRRQGTQEDGPGLLELLLGQAWTKAPSLCVTATVEDRLAELRPPARGCPLQDTQHRSQPRGPDSEPQKVIKSFQPACKMRKACSHPTRPSPGSCPSRTPPLLGRAKI